MNAFAEILVIALFTAISCALPGNFLVLRKMSMLTDAISHTVLLGIILAFLLTGNLDSPLLIIGATLMGVLTVWLIESLYRSRLVASDASIGLIFPFLFSIAVILVTRYAGNVHIDTDCVLLGELAFAPFDRLVIDGTDYGARGIYTSGFTLCIVIFAITLFYKELKLASFDSTLCEILGFSPALIHYGLMSLVSLTAVTSFQTIGSILVIAFMIIPAMTASLWRRTMGARLFLSCLIGAIASIAGIVGAIWLDTSLAGMMASVLGLLFIFSLCAAPSNGLVAAFRRRKSQRFSFGRETLLQHLLFHDKTEAVARENAVSNLAIHMKWPENFTRKVCRSLLKDKYVYQKGDLLIPTEQGRDHNIFYRKNLHR